MRITSGENSTISEGGILLLLFTLSCRYNTLSVVTKSAEFLRRPGKPSLFNRVGKHDAFHPIVNFTNIAAGIHSTNDGIGVPSVPTTNRHGRLLTTGTAVGCCLEYCLHRTKSTVVVVNAWNTPAVWSAVRVMNRRHAVIQTINHQTHTW